ncbi:MAG: serine/threonine-protein kinase [Polyangiales bacterium]
MKRCPSCQRTFTDDLSFCVEDASALEDGGVRTLADLTHGGTALAPRRAVDIAVSLCAALDPSRNRGRVPLPVTALDVELDGDKARVTFSLDGSKPVRDAQTLDPAAPFSAPETLSEGDAVTPSATVYNIAALLYQSLTGDVPFDASTNAAVAVRKLLEDAPSARAMVPSIPADLDALITRALDRAASERPQTPAAFADLLRAIELPAESPAPVIAPAPRATAPATPPVPVASYGAAPGGPPPPSAFGAAPGAAPSPASFAPLGAAPELSAAPPPMAAAQRSGSGRGLIIAGVVVALASLASLSLVLTSRSADAPMSSSRPAPAQSAQREPASRSSGGEPSPARTAAAPAQPQPAPMMQPTPTVAVAPPSAPAPHRPTTSYGAERPHRAARPARAARRGQGGSSSVGSEDFPLGDLNGSDVAMAPSAPAPAMQGPTVAIERPSYNARLGRSHRTPRTTPRSEPAAPPPPPPEAEPTPPPPAAEPIAPPAPASSVPTQGAGSESATRQGVQQPVGATPPTPVFTPQPQPRSDSNGALLLLALGAAVVGLASIATGVFLMRRRAKAQPLATPPWPAQTTPPHAPPVALPQQLPQHLPPLAPQPLPPAPPSLPETFAGAADPRRDALWKGSVEHHDTVADAAWASTVQVSRSAASTSAVWCTRCGTQCPSEARFCPNDGADLSQVGTTIDPHASRVAAPPAAPEMKPFTVGSYRCEARLGEGGMGVVYKARHLREGYAVAVKVLLLGGRAEGSLIERFRREARLAASIKHPNSVAIYDYGELDGRLFYLAMEFIDGRSLDALMGDRPMALARATSIVRQVCAGLAEAHAAGIVHRDLKPANVMVCERADGTDLVKLVDFGIARDLRATGERTMAGIVVGTPAYMAPEQARGEPGVDARADVFAVGVMTYELLSGRHPYEARGNAIQQIVARATLHDEAPPLSSAVPSVPPSLDGVLARAITPDPAARTASVRSFSEELTSAVSVGAAA